MTTAKRTGAAPPGGAVALLAVLLVPLELIGLIVFGVYMVAHWRDFTASTAAILAWFVWFASLCAYLGLAYLAVRVLLVLAHGLAHVLQQLADTRLALAQRALLYTAERYVVYMEAGQIRVQSTAQVQGAPVVVRSDQEAEEAAPQALPEPEPQPQPEKGIPTFRDLLTRGIIQATLAQGKMLLGYQVQDGTLRSGSWLDLYSVGIGGVSGSGKTTTVRFLLFQAVLAGARLVMIDPHIGEPEESLAAQFQALPGIHQLPPCDDAPDQVLRRVTWLNREYRRRKSGASHTVPIIFVVDELNGLLRRLDDERKKALADLLLDIAQEGRKFGMFALLIAQRWSHADLGGGTIGAAIRDSLASSIAHRFKSEAQARLLVGGRESALCLELPAGQFLFRDTDGGLAHMITPDTRVEDGAIIANLLASNENESETTSETTRSVPETTRVLVVSEPTTDELETTKMSRFQENALAVSRLMAHGMNKAEIMRQIWGVNPGGNAEYRAALAEYQAVMAYIAERIAS